MEKEEFNKKYLYLKILKSIQEYLKSDDNAKTTVFPIRVPDELIYQTLKLKGAKNADTVVHDIFKMGLNIWSENQYNTVFGSQQSLEEFIELVKKQNKEDT
jgi:hypothetical protein